MNRRRFLSSVSSVLAGLGLGHPGFAAGRPQAAHFKSHQPSVLFHKRLQALEKLAQGRLGVHVVDTATGAEFGHRQDERFMLLSTFKMLAGAFVLNRVDAGEESLERRIAYSKEDLIEWSPVTEKHADGKGMALDELCGAAISFSDNTAANLLLSSFGGPPALTAFLRQLGDGQTRLDRKELELNYKSQDGLWDTTTPRAMAHTVRKLVLGDALSAPSRHLLQQWLINNTTGDHRLKAGLPEGWRIGDKTGTNSSGANDVAVIWPPHRPPIVVTAYLQDSLASAATRETALAKLGESVAAFIQCLPTYRS